MRRPCGVWDVLTPTLTHCSSGTSSGSGALYFTWQAWLLAVFLPNVNTHVHIHTHTHTQAVHARTRSHKGTPAHVDTHRHAHPSQERKELTLHSYRLGAPPFPLPSPRTHCHHPYCRCVTQTRPRARDCPLSEAAQSARSLAETADLGRSHSDVCTLSPRPDPVHPISDVYFQTKWPQGSCYRLCTQVSGQAWRPWLGPTAALEREAAEGA